MLICKILFCLGCSGLIFKDIKRVRSFFCIQDIALTLIDILLQIVAMVVFFTMADGDTVTILLCISILFFSLGVCELRTVILSKIIDERIEVLSKKIKEIEEEQIQRTEKSKETINGIMKFLELDTESKNKIAENVLELNNENFILNNISYNNNIMYIDNKRYEISRLVLEAYMHFVKSGAVVEKIIVKKLGLGTFLCLTDYNKAQILQLDDYGKTKSYIETIYLYEDAMDEFMGTNDDESMDLPQSMGRKLLFKRKTFCVSKTLLAQEIKVEREYITAIENGEIKPNIFIRYRIDKAIEKIAHRNYKKTR